MIKTILRETIGGIIVLLFFLVCFGVGLIEIDKQAAKQEMIHGRR